MWSPPDSISGMFSVLPLVFFGSIESVGSISLIVEAYAAPYRGKPPPGVAVPSTTTVFCCANAAVILAAAATNNAAARTCAGRNSCP